MSSQTATARRPTRDRAASDRALDLGAAVRWGLIGGVAATFVAAAGIVAAFGTRTVVNPGITLGYVLLLAIPAVVAAAAAKPPAEIEGVDRAPVGASNILSGAIAGAVTGAVTGAFVLLADSINLRTIFVNVSPQMLDLVTFSQGATAGAVLLVAVMAALGALSGAVYLIPERPRRALFLATLTVIVVGTLQGLVQQVLRGARVPEASSFLFERGGGLTVAGAITIFLIALAARMAVREPGQTRRRWEALPQEKKLRWSVVGAIVIVLLLAVLPHVLGQFLSEVFNIAGIFLLMALGLNIVVGYAGLLDLGYVAFFAVGAYTTALLTSANAPRWDPGLVFWSALPFVILAAAVAGILVGTPVLRMRGDYLAIVTLGFGEIARLLLLSNWLTPTFGGAQGILRIPGVPVGGFEVRHPQPYVYLIYGFIILAVYVSWSLKESRIGRAWMAMREDEPVAEAMGVDIVRAKLSAFVVGAILAGFGGALFASKIGSVFPHSFDIVVSITILVVVIVGGMGSIPGVILGAFVIVGLPELLREFAEYKFLFYGALLIFMMLKRPEGFIPSKQRAQELHQEEVMQDAWLKGNVDQAERGPAATS